MSHTIRMHRYLSVTEVNGPGKRFGLWVQGCKGVPQLNASVRHCSGCWNAHTWSRNAGTVISVDEVFILVQHAVREHGVEGITFSGGEPFQQARALAELARRCREELNLNVVIFIGYTVEFLRSHPAPEGSTELLAVADLLIDGPYTQVLRTTELPLRGSSNQRLVPLSPAGAALAARVTDELPVVEFNFTNSGEVAVTGFPM